MFIANPHPNLHGVALDGHTPKIDVLAFITGGYVIDDRHLLVGPNVHTRLLPEAMSQAIITPRSSIDHSNAGSRPSRWQQLLGWISRTDVTEEPHLQFDLDGAVAQFVPFNRRADCNYRANGWWFAGTYFGALSHETGDEGAATLDRTPWTVRFDAGQPAMQFDALVGVHIAECVTYRIRCTPTTGPFDSGIGYHSMYPEWSKYTGKTCPGAARIRQMPELWHRVAVGVAAFYEHCGGVCP